jgi:stearoyl-CoA desaturase (Delta-9 desaturase)
LAFVPKVVVAVLLGFALSQFALLLTTVWLHRTLSHRAMSVRPGVTWTFRVLIWITTGIRPRQWVAVHRKHHAHTDVTGDPHSPVLEGFAAVQFNNVGLYRRVAKNPMEVERYARDIRPDRWDRLFFDHALFGLSVGVGILVLTLGWRAALVAAAVHTVSYLLLNAAVNAVGHTFGSQPYDNPARNSRWLALVTMGEGNHNNHHGFPTSARLAVAKDELDFAWWFVRLLESRGWATVRHRGPVDREQAAA